MDGQTRPAPVPASLQAGAEGQQDQLAVMDTSQRWGVNWYLGETN